MSNTPSPRYEVVTTFKATKTDSYGTCSSSESAFKHEPSDTTSTDSSSSTSTVKQHTSTFKQPTSPCMDASVLSGPAHSVFSDSSTAITFDSDGSITSESASRRNSSVDVETQEQGQRQSSALNVICSTIVMVLLLFIGGFAAIVVVGFVLGVVARLLEWAMGIMVTVPW